MNDLTRKIFFACVETKKSRKYVIMFILISVIIYLKCLIFDSQNDNYYYCNIYWWMQDCVVKLTLEIQTNLMTWIAFQNSCILHALAQCRQNIFESKVHIQRLKRWYRRVHINFHFLVFLPISNWISLKGNWT